MIYTKGKAGHYMGNTDIVAAPLSDAMFIHFRIIQMGKPFCQVLKLAKCMMAHSYTSKNMELMRTTFPH